MVVSDDPAATVMAAGSVANSGLDKDDDPAAPTISEAAAFSMLEKGMRNKSETKDIDIQAFYVILQLGMGCGLIAQLLPHDVGGPSTCLIHLHRRHQYVLRCST